MIPLSALDGELELPIFAKYSSTLILHEMDDYNTIPMVEWSQIESNNNPIINSNKILSCDAIEEDAKKLLTHAFEYKNICQKLRTNMIPNNQMLQHENNHQIEFNPHCSMINETLAYPSKDTESYRYILPIVEIPPPLQNQQTTTLPNFCADITNLLVLDHKNWDNINLPNKPYNHQIELCDMCSHHPTNYIPYNNLHNLNCCRLNVFYSLAYTLGEDDCKGLFKNYNNNNNKICFPLKSDFDNLIMMEKLKHTNLSNPNRLFKEKCKGIWRDYYHQTNTCYDHANMCNNIENNVSLCRKLLNHQINLIENLFKIIPGSRIPSQPVYNDHLNPIPYKLCPQLSKLYARYLSVLVDMDYIIGFLDKNFMSMLPSSLGSNFSKWMQTLTDFNTFMKKYTLSDGSNESIHLNDIEDGIDSAKNFHYCKHFPTQQELQELSIHIDEIYKNLLYGPFILNFCILVFQKKISKRQLQDVGFDQNLIPHYIWDHPFESLLQDMSSVVRSLAPHHIDR